LYGVAHSRGTAWPVRLSPKEFRAIQFEFLRVKPVRTFGPRFAEVKMQLASVLCLQQGNLLRPAKTKRSLESRAHQVVRHGNSKNNIDGQRLRSEERRVGKEIRMR